MRKNPIKKQGKQNSKISNANKQKSNKVKFTSSKEGVTRVPLRREFLQNIPAPTSQDFTSFKLEVNPGLFKSFPWLSGVAPSFQKYKFRKLKFIYETAVSTFSPGMVMMAPVFNVSYPVPDSKVKLLELTDAVRGPIWENFEVDMTSRAIDVYKEYFVRVDDVGELKLYDALYLVFASDAVALDVPYIGELWVEYEIDLFEPAYPNTSGIANDNYVFITGALPSNNVPFNSSTTIKGGKFPVTLVGSSSIQFGEAFTGVIWTAIDQKNLGLASSIYENALTTATDSTTGVVRGEWAVGGNGTDGNTNGWAMWSVSCNNMQKGDIISFTNFGFFADTETEQANSFSMYVVNGIDYFNPMIPPTELKIKVKGGFPLNLLAK